MNFPATMTVEQLNALHPDAKRLANTYADIDLLACGGKELKDRASRFLAKKPRELSDVYAARLNRFTYQNILGTVIAWYQSAMFAEKPSIDAPDGDVFLANCDRAGTPFNEALSVAFLSMLKYGRVFALTDLPAIDGDFPTLAIQQQAGALDPYIVILEPSQLLDWASDAYGNLEWIVFTTTEQRREFGGKPETIRLWYVFDRTMCAIYEAGENETVARLEEGYPRLHATSEAGRVPVRVGTLPEGLWLGNRGLLGAVTHLDLQNALHWGLYNACLPTLVVKGEYRDAIERTEVGFVHLDTDGSMEYVEPGGSSFQIAREEIAAVREEIYRQMYLQAQGRSSSATASASSGYSKELDMLPAQDVLNGMGDALRALAQGILDDVSVAQGAGEPQYKVRGFEFADVDETGALETALGAKDLAIPSDRLERELNKRTARKLLADADPSIIAEIEKEIDAAPSKEERAKFAADQLQRRMDSAFGPPIAPPS